MPIKIGYKTYQVICKDRLYTEKPEELYGQIDHDKKIIELSAHYDIDQRICTLLHEVIHGVDNDRSLKLGEHQITQLAIGLYQVVKDNPEFLKNINNEIGGSPT